MSGKHLDLRLSLMRPDARALMALSLTRDVTLTHLTRKQAARLAGVSPYSVAIAALATLDERFRLKQGRLKLSDVRKAHAHPHTPSDAEVDAVINRIGADRIMARIDELTAPDLPKNTPDLTAELQPAMAAE